MAHGWILDGWKVNVNHTYKSYVWTKPKQKDFQSTLTNYDKGMPSFKLKHKTWKSNMRTQKVHKT